MTTSRGIGGTGPEAVGRLLEPAWEAFLALARTADESRPTRLPGWTGRDVLVHLGVWPDRHAVADLVESARAGANGPLPDVDAVNAAVVAAHADASGAEVLAALERHRDAVVAYLAQDDRSLDAAPAMSTAGPLPLLSVLLGEAYELAVHALDLAAAGASPPAPDLLDAGVAALAEVTGALVSRTGLEAGATLRTPGGGWTFAAQGTAGWTVERVGAHLPPGAAVEGEAAVILEASAGRSNPVVQVARRRLKLHDTAALLRLAPIAEATPGIPGGPLLSVAARSLSGAGGLLGRLRRS